MFIQKSVDIHQLREQISQAKTVDEIKELRSSIPELSFEEELIAHRNLNDGIYNDNGTLIGEKHPDD